MIRRPPPAPLFPLWLRAWHWANAAVFLALVLTGLSLHYADPQVPLVPFAAARAVHNAAGLTLGALWLVFVASNVRSGLWRHYRIRPRGWARGARRQAAWYLRGIFRGAPHPFTRSARAKFNPLQAVAYLGIMVAWFPLILASGLLLMFPDLAPARVAGWGGVWPMAVLHLIAGFAGTLFLLGHVYLATTGETVGAEFITMWRGDAPAGRTRT